MRALQCPTPQSSESITASGVAAGLTLNPQAAKPHSCRGTHTPAGSMPRGFWQQRTQRGACCLAPSVTDMSLNIMAIRMPIAGATSFYQNVQVGESQAAAITRLRAGCRLDTWCTAAACQTVTCSSLACTMIADGSSSCFKCARLLQLACSPSMTSPRLVCLQSVWSRCNAHPCQARHPCAAPS